ncbi:MAG: EVE domain-containing protein [Candidatus Magasanikbacteria bacterium RIFOXYC12_FULL_33_11]|uniref:EVE domain-containing protein n=1 Tax=Candidatus Magasanikbacteria bacterium RIFOXYC12_FULL_33_11 TaxID=1798701 RepID=A0A1F6NLV7_9BACT|nr:MAG: EVE domain-containing protein [Candidatus Magasanikbacteria bacterium RIFOXYC12_FULL_33_11]
MNHWIIKSEASVYSIDDLQKDKQTPWTGVRNYQARNFMRDKMMVGDKVIFYHSNDNPPHIAGFVKVVSMPYSDVTQFDKNSHYFDPKSTKENPRWFLVDMAFVKKSKRKIGLDELKNDKKLEGLMLIKKGQRLSVQPVSKEHFDYIEKLCL